MKQVLMAVRNLLAVRPNADDRTLKVLGETRLFENLSLLDLERLAATTETREYAAGELIFRLDEPGDGMYVIDEGEVEIFLAGPDGETRLARLTDRDYFGEMSLIDERGRRTAAARARGPARCLFLAKTAFDQLLGSSHATSAKILFQLCRVLSRRLARTSRLAAGQEFIASPEPPLERPELAESAPTMIPPPPPPRNS